MNKELDKARRARYRVNNMRAGKCRWCPRPIFQADRGECLYHRVKYLLRKRGLLEGVQPAHKARKIDALVAYLHGRETAIQSGFLVPGDDAQMLKDVIELRLRLGITWGGVRGADKMVDIVRSLDRHSLKVRKNGQTAPPGRTV